MPVVDGSSPLGWMGRGWAFPPSFGGPSRSVDMVAAHDDVRQAIEILLSTSPGERILEPTFGCGLQSLVFESLDDNTSTAIVNTIEQAVLFFEPRVTLDRVDLDDRDRLDGVVHVHIDYTVKADNSRGNLVYPFYFREARQ